MPVQFIKFAIYIFSVVSFSADRLYTADEVSNTVSIINPKTNDLIGQIYLGLFRSESFKSFVPIATQINVHGIDASPDHKMLAVTSNITNSVILIDTQSLKFIKLFSVGRSPHTSNFTPDGKELWVSNRGQSFISIIDLKKMKIKQELQTMPSPSYTQFVKKNNLAFVSSGYSKSVQVYNYKTKKLVKTISTANIFSPVMALSSDEKEIWLVQKDIDSVLRINTETLAKIESFKTGVYTQHTQFLIKDGKKLGLVTVGGESSLKIYSFETKKVILEKTVQLGGLPHAVFASPDGKYIYVGLEHSDEIAVISTDHFVLEKKISVGNSPQAIIYVKNAVDEIQKHEFEHLKPINTSIKSFSIALGGDGGMSGSLSVRSEDYLDFLTLELYNPKLNSDFEIKIGVLGSRFKSEENILLGYVKCLANIFVCKSETALPLNEKFRKLMRDKKYVIFIIDAKSDKLISQIESELK